MSVSDKFNIELFLQARKVLHEMKIMQNRIILEEAQVCKMWNLGVIDKREVVVQNETHKYRRINI